MSDVRTAQEIQQEYSQVCLQMGDLIVKKANAEAAVEQSLNKVKALNFELMESNAHYAKLQRELEEKKAQAPAA